MRAHGYTLVEMVVAVAVLAILAAAAIPLMGPVNENKLDAAASEIANALRFARVEAMRTGSIRGVDFSVDPATGKRRIRVFRTDAATPPNPVYDVYHPLDKKLYDIQLATGPGTQGATISKAAFVYFRPLFTFVTQDQAAFDASGNPEYYPDAANFSLTLDVFSPAQIAVSLAGKSRTVSLDTVTGRVTVQ
jgi:prepilin-type N-terminal cleavage/methylation domain-containing protein